MINLIDKVELKYGPIEFTIEEVGTGFRAVSTYCLNSHPTLAGKVLTNRSKIYKSLHGATKEANRMSSDQCQRD